MLNQCIALTFHMLHMQNSRNSAEKKPKISNEIDFYFCLNFVLPSIYGAGKHFSTTVKCSNSLNVFRSFFFDSFNLPRVAAQLEKLMGSR